MMTQKFALRREGAGLECGSTRTLRGEDWPDMATEAAAAAASSAAGLASSAVPAVCTGRGGEVALPMR